MNISLSVFWSILQTFVLMGVGILALRLGMFKPESLSGLTRLDLDIFTPALTFYSITNHFDRSHPQELWLMPLLGLGIIVVSYLAGFLARHGLKNDTPERRGTVHHLCTINNYLFLPIIVIANLYGPREVTLLLLMSIGSIVGLWTLGILSIQSQTLTRESLRSIFGINLWAVIAGLLVVFAGWNVPAVLNKTIEMTANMAVPMMLILSGAGIWQQRRQLGAAPRDAAYVLVLRLVLIPALLLLLLHFLPLPTEVLHVAQVVAVMPAAVISVPITSRYGGNDAFSGQAIVLTTLASLITVPLWLWLLLAR